MASTIHRLLLKLLFIYVLSDHFKNTESQLNTNFKDEKVMESIKMMLSPDINKYLGKQDATEEGNPGIPVNPKPFNVLSDLQTKAEGTIKHNEDNGPYTEMDGSENHFELPPFGYPPNSKDQSHLGIKQISDEMQKQFKDADFNHDIWKPFYHEDSSEAPKHNDGVPDSEKEMFDKILESLKLSPESFSTMTQPLDEIIKEGAKIDQANSHSMPDKIAE